VNCVFKQDMVGKLRDACKSLERTAQMWILKWYCYPTASHVLKHYSSLFSH